MTTLLTTLFNRYNRENPMAIWNSRSPINTMLVPANTVGDLQRGLMTQVANKHPEMVQRYIEMCVAGEVVLGKVVVLRPAINPNKVQFMFCPIRTVSTDPISRYALSDCLEDVVRIAKAYHISGIATIKLGCGSEPTHYLPWVFVCSEMLRTLGRIGCPVSIHIGTNDPTPSGYEVREPKITRKLPVEVVATGKPTSGDMLAAHIRVTPCRSVDGHLLTAEEKEALIVSCCL